MKFTVLSSGSKANATYVQAADGQGMLIDCGLSGMQVRKRLGALGIDPHSIKAIVLTHEHHDHVAGAHTIARDFKAPIFCTPGTKAELPWLEFRTAEIHTFEDHETFVTPIGLEVSAFPISHDAAQPVGFTISSAAGASLGMCTDLGMVTPQVRDSLMGVHALVVESNHDLGLLWECSYTWDLKRRIAGQRGHLSNLECGILISQLLHTELHTVVLAHLSENSNSPEVARAEFERAIPAAARERLSLLCGSVTQPTPLLEVLPQERYADQVIGA